MRARGDVLSRGGASEENGSEQTTATKPDHFSDGHVITRLSGKRIVTQEEGKVQRRESRTDMLGDRRPCDGAAVLSLRAAPYPVAARRRAVTVLVSPLHMESRRPQLWLASSFFSYICGHTFVWPLALLGRHVFFIVGHLVAVARYARAHVCKHSCAGAGEPRRAESWRSAAASSARWIGSRRSPKLGAAL